MKNKTIAITGHSGVLGKNFINNYKNNKYLKCRVDIADRKKVFKWIKDLNFDIFLHFASIVPIAKVNQNKKKAYKVNYLGTKNIIDALIKYNKKIWFFYASTSHVYGYKKNLYKFKETDKVYPLNFYGKTKLLSENYIKKTVNTKKINYCIGRIFSFTDAYQKNSFFIPSIFQKIFNSKNKKIIFKNTNCFRDFIYIKDITKCISLLNRYKAEGIYNISSGNLVNLEDIIFKSLILTKLKKKISFISNKNKMNIISDNRKLLKKIRNFPKKKIDYILNEYYKSKFN